MFTVDTVIDSLKKYDIEASAIQQWEEQLGLAIPTDSFGRRQYSPHHINLFRNVKKNLALGRSIEEIKTLITLPPEATSKPQAMAKVMPKTPLPAQQTQKPYATVPYPNTSNPVSIRQERSSQMMQMLERLVDDKNKIHEKLLETEKLNSHLYNANGMFHRKVKEMDSQLGNLREQVQENRSFQLLDEKSKLHEQLIHSEKNNQMLKKEMDMVQEKLHETEQRHQSETLTAREQYKEMEQVLDRRIQDLDEQLAQATQDFNPQRFCGNWQEETLLTDIEYDNFGINIETHRERIFRISEPPARTFGNTAIITTQYAYETNTLWKRIETLVLTYLSDDRLEGELFSEYIIDGVPVAKAAYRVTCQKSD